MNLLERLNQWATKQMIGEADNCLICKYADIQDNPLSKNFPIVYCGLEPGRKQVLLPKTRPRWCKR